MIHRAKNKLSLGILAAAAALTALFSSTPAALAQPPITNTPPKWETSAAAGVTLTRGNSRTLLTTADLNTSRKTKEDEFLAGIDAAYGENDGMKNAELLHGFGQYNRLATGHFYYGIRLDGLHDGVAEVRYRFTVAPLAGYYLIKETNMTLSVEAGPAFVYQKSGDKVSSTAALRLGERYEWKFSSTARLWQSAEILPQVDYFKNYYVNAEIGVESALTTHLSLRTYLQDTYYNIPAVGRLKNDAKLVAALAYKF